MSEVKRNITSDAIECDITTNEKEKQPTKFNEKNYLSVKLNVKGGERKKEMRIRLLPFDSETQSPFKIIKMHNCKVNKTIAESGFKNYVCIEHSPNVNHDIYGDKCPFCELNKTAYEKSTKATTEEEKRAWQKISLENIPRDVCIVRCIERGAESDGPKFWKFFVRNDKKDPMNIIKNIYFNRKQESIEEEYGDKAYGKSPEQIKAMCNADGFKPFNVLDIYEGKDLKLAIECVYDKEGKPTSKTNITITDYGKVQPISNNEEEINSWIDDSKKWTDVFAIKPYDYLSIVLDGEVPFFDKTTNKWVASNFNKDKTEEKIEIDSEIQNSIPVDTPIPTPTVVIDENEDDLPF